MVLVILVAVTAVAGWATHVVVRDQEGRLLVERAGEVRLVLSQSIADVPATLTSLGDVLQAAGGSPAAFDRAASAQVAASPGRVGYAMLKPGSGGRFVVVATVGGTIRVGQVISDVRAATMASALRSPGVIATPVIGSGPQRTLGFAMGPPVAPAGTVVYREALLGPLQAPRAANTAPFHEVRVALYASRNVDPQQVLVATTPELPLRGSVRYESLTVGHSTWLLAVSAIQPLVGSVAAGAQWFVLAVGLVGSILAAVAVEGEGRRREAAAALYAGEHQVAETFQRSLLPVLPELTGLELATRYLAGGTGQQVGGDWFDVFELGSGRVGIVIGDVIGHDIVAATAMSQIRAALRAYAWQGDEPSAVLDRLDRLVSAFSVAQLVTVFYGVLEAPAPDGTRLLSYANAGHLSPLLRAPDGRVEALADESSVIIGAPRNRPRTQADHRLLPGSTLVLFTDGLVEVPGGSLDDALGRLVTLLGDTDIDQTMEMLCEEIIDAMPVTMSHDDVAVLAIRAAAAPSAGEAHQVTTDLQQTPNRRPPRPTGSPVEDHRGSELRTAR